MVHKHHQPARQRFLPFAAHRSWAGRPRLKSYAFTTERNQVLMMTIFTTYSQKTIFQTTALEVRFKF
jgi:hypothetical protein